MPLSPWYWVTSTSEMLSARSSSPTSCSNTSGSSSRSWASICASGFRVVLADVVLHAGLKPLGKPNKSLAVADESRCLASLLCARVLLDDLRVKRRLRRLAAGLDQVLGEHDLRDGPVVHRLPVAVAAQHVFSSIREREALLRKFRRTASCGSPDAACSGAASKATSPAMTSGCPSAAAGLRPNVFVSLWTNREAAPFFLRSL
jgi:hypothetical protein